ncbi:MAG: S46 family peptidase [Verrucomicrobia bacterium]|nr:S46 family peptidase [Verrucomicrobiota bacterium]
MQPLNNRLRTALLGIAVVITSFKLLADEGMWLFNNPPRQQLMERYGFEITDAWLERLMKASVRFNSGGSGSFVSPDGLLISNHHVAADALQKLSTAERNLLQDGFMARSRAEEIPCVDLELNVLQSIEDVTARVNAAVPPDAGPTEALLARRAVIAEIEKESRERTGLRSDVVTLYQGGAYHLYRFKRYTDVRLVFAPEQQIAFFGGDPDNFEYPRYVLDVAFFRAYENGQPAQIEHFLKWSAKGAADGELTFVSGHPGRTSRLLTLAELEYLRDVAYPYQLDLLKRREVLLSVWSARSEENARRAKDDLFGVQNSRKARDGGIAGLYDPVLMGRLAANEAALRQAMHGRSEFAEALAAYDRIAAAQKEIARHALRYRLLEGAHAFNGSLFGIARTLLRAGDERPKPNGDRLPEFRDSGRESLELDLFSTKPIHDEYEQLLLADSLLFLAEKLGWNDPTVRAVLAGKSPRVRAAELVEGTRVKNVAVRKQLYEGGAAAVAAAGDPMIELARLVDAEARELRKAVEAQDEVKRQSQAAISSARFALQGASVYPDATFTLRLAFGVVKGYEEGGKAVPAMTTLAGLYERAAEMKSRPPFDLPERWLKKKRALDLRTPFNFVGTHDIIGGNSGSPVVNRNGEFVGIIFDGNIHSLVWDFAFDDTVARSLSVHSAGIVESLRKVYRANDLVAELTGKRASR